MNNMEFDPILKCSGSTQNFHFLSIRERSEYVDEIIVGEFNEIPAFVISPIDFYSLLNFRKVGQSDFCVDKIQIPIVQQPDRRSALFFERSEKLTSRIRNRIDGNDIESFRDGFLRRSM
jgi:hypothetical protein